METEVPKPLLLGEWVIDPANSLIRRNGESIPLEVRSMRLLLTLAARPGEIVSSDELLQAAWAGVAVSQDSVYQAIASLRRLLGDDPKQPSYIATVPRLGYRLVAPVSDYKPDVPLEPSKPGHLRRNLIITAAVLILFLAGLLLSPRLHRQIPPAQPVAIAVLPFGDLSPGMTEGEFTDGMTEELIDKLSKVPGLRVPAPSAVFYYRDKQIALSDMAKSLGVSYVLDGSVRKSGGQVRIATRLVRAQTGYVVWSETYDRPFHDVIQIQDEIAAQVIRSVQSTDLPSQP